MSPVSFGGDGVIVGHRVADFGFENVEPGAEDGVVDHERGEDLDHLVIGAARFDDQPGVEAGGGHGRGQLARPDIDAAHHAAAAHLEAMVGGDAGEPRFEQLAAPRDVALEIAAAPEMPERRSEEHTSELQSLMRISYAVL